MSGTRTPVKSPGEILYEEWVVEVGKLADVQGAPSWEDDPRIHSFMAAVEHRLLSRFRACGACYGHGDNFFSELPCPKCDGTGWVAKGATE